MWLNLKKKNRFLCEKNEANMKKKSTFIINIVASYQYNFQKKKNNNSPRGHTENLISVIPRKPIQLLEAVVYCFELNPVLTCTSAYAKKVMMKT